MTAMIVTGTPSLRARVVWSSTRQFLGPRQNPAPPRLRSPAKTRDRRKSAELLASPWAAVLLRSGSRTPLKGSAALQPQTHARRAVLVDTIEDYAKCVCRRFSRELGSAGAASSDACVRGEVAREAALRSRTVGAEVLCRTWPTLHTASMILLLLAKGEPAIPCRKVGRSLRCCRDR